MKRSPGLVLTALLLLVTACTGDGTGDKDEESEGSSPEQARALSSSWETDLDSKVDEVYLAGEHVVLALDDEIVGLDRETGEQAWSRPARGFCQTTAPRGEDGYVAVAFTNRGPNAACTHVGVIDTDTGNWLWKKRLATPMESRPFTGDPPLAAGDSTVTVLTECCYAEALRFDLRTGRSLKTLDPDLTGWGAEVATDGQTIALASGLGPDNRVRLAVHDADSGKLLWRKNVHELVEENVATSVLSSDPLILSTSQRGHRLTWQIDRRTGEFANPIGRQTNDVEDPEWTSWGVHDGHLVVTQPPQDAGPYGLAAYDVETGEEKWSGFPASGSFAGFDESGSMIVVNDQALDEGALVTRHQVGDLHDHEVLGKVESDTPPDRDFVLGDLLLVTHDDVGRATTTVSAYPLPGPGEGQGTDVEITGTNWDADWTAVPPVDEATWAEDDVRPGAIASCHPPKSVLRALGFHRLGLPPQRSCRWFERQEPFGIEREFEARYEITTPDPAGKATATEQARARIEQLADEGSFSLGKVDPGKFVAVEGVGDQAYVATATGPGAFAETQLLVRIDNLVVKVAARGQADTTEVVGGSVAGNVVEDAALATAEHLFAQADRTLGTLPEPARAGRVAHPQPVCTQLDSVVRTYVPDGRRLDQKAKRDPDDRTAGCYWGTGNDSYTKVDGQRQYFRFAKIVAHAVPGSRLNQRNGVSLARTGITRLRKGAGGVFYEKARKVPGLGDEAYLFPAEYSTSGAQVVVRIDNLLFQVSVNDQANPDLEWRSDAAIALAQRVAASYQ